MGIKKEVIIGDCRLLLGDCMEVMPLLGKVDAIVTDPPYGIKADSVMAKQSGQQYGNAAAPKNIYAATEWDNVPMSNLARDLILSKADSIIIWGGNYFELKPSSCWLIWDKENGSNGFADCELAWTNLKKAARLKKHMWNGMLRKGGEERCGHPTQKPVEIMRWCIQQLPKDVETILDPFMGSGTTGVACAKMGRKFIGIELDEGYFDIACKRIEEAYKSPDMFIEASKKAEQLNFEVNHD